MKRGTSVGAAALQSSRKGSAGKGVESVFAFAEGGRGREEGPVIDARGINGKEQRVEKRVKWLGHSGCRIWEGGTLGGTMSVVYGEESPREHRLGAKFGPAALTKKERARKWSPRGRWKGQYSSKPNSMEILNPHTGRSPIIH